MWLGDADGMGQLTDAELVVLHQQHEAAQACVVGKSRKKLVRVNIHKTEYIVSRIYLQMNILLQRSHRGLIAHQSLNLNETVMIL